MNNQQLKEKDVMPDITIVNEDDASLLGFHEPAINDDEEFFDIVERQNDSISPG